MPGNDAGARRVRRGWVGDTCAPLVALCWVPLPRDEAVISPVRVNLEAGELSQWLPADYSLVSRSSWLSPRKIHGGEEEKKVDSGSEVGDEEKGKGMTKVCKI